MGAPSYNEMIEVLDVDGKERVAFRIRSDQLQEEFDAIMDMVETKLDDPVFTREGDEILIHARDVTVPK